MSEVVIMAGVVKATKPSGRESQTRQRGSERHKQFQERRDKQVRKQHRERRDRDGDVAAHSVLFTEPIAVVVAAIDMALGTEPGRG